MLTLSPFDKINLDEAMSVNNTHPKSKVGLDYLGLAENNNVLWNLNPEELYEEVLANGEGELTADEAISIRYHRFQEYKQSLVLFSNQICTLNGTLFQSLKTRVLG